MAMTTVVRLGFDAAVHLAAVSDISSAFLVAALWVARKAAKMAVDSALTMVRQMVDYLVGD